MVDAIARACADAHAQARADSGKAKGKAKGDVVVPFVRKEDIVRSVAPHPPSTPPPFFFGSPLTFARPTYLTLVGDDFSLAEAQKMTSMYAKMEYGVKRLLWLGG